MKLLNLGHVLEFTHGTPIMEASIKNTVQATESCEVTDSDTIVWTLNWSLKQIPSASGTQTQS